MNEVQQKAYEIYNKFYSPIWNKVNFDDDMEVASAAIECSIIHLNELLEELCQAKDSYNYKRIEFLTKVRLELMGQGGTSEKSQDRELHLNSPYKNPICRGSKRFGNNCGVCEKCKSENNGS